MTGEFDLTKLSVGAFAGVGDRYRLLRSGAALGPRRRSARRRARAADARRGGRRPDRHSRPATTTAYRLLRLAAPGVSARSSRCATTGSSAPSSSGDVDAGLIIHESRFTYADHGLVKVIDLGDWWERETGLPVPLAGICARADLDADDRPRRPSAPSAPRCSTRSIIRRRAATTCARTRRRCPTRSARSTSRSTSTSTASTSATTGMRAIARLVALAPDSQPACTARGRDVRRGRRPLPLPEHHKVA